jgi:rfaE bifunctional protein kinase chain/domain
MDPESFLDDRSRSTGAVQALPEPDLGTLLARMRDARVAVVGDFCLDSYWQLDDGPEEESIETGLPVHRVTSQRYSPGGAGNVVANLVSLGVVQVRAIGLYGGDPFGSVLVELLADLGADTSGMLDLGADWQTLVYAKPYIGAEEQSRLDFGTRAGLPQGASDVLGHVIDEAAGWADVVVINQQVTSCFAAEPMVARVNDVIASHPGTVFVVDTRMSTTAYVGAVLKLNVAEAMSRFGEAAPGPVPVPVPEDQVVELAGRMTRQTGKDLFITRGERGIVAAGNGGVYVTPGVDVSGEVDPVGAGDTVVAAIAGVLACGGDAPLAAYVANLAASVTVRKLRTTGTTTPSELAAAAAGAYYVYGPDLAEDAAKARLWPASEIEVIMDPPPGRRTHFVFDFDGTLSVLREGWDDVMQATMVQAIVGDASASIGAERLASVRSAARDLIDRTTGVPTLLQMRGLVGLVRQFGYVAEADIRDEPSYKELYNTQLMCTVRKRLARVAAGHLQPTDFHMKGAVRLLDELRSREIKLYLASGTDVDDVRAEAQALGFAGYFEGRIYGSVRDMNVDAKSMVLDQILAEGVAPGAVVTIGDGPAEMREARKRGGIAVGLCSDERRRFGANPAKRGRLIRAGATVILPDYTDLGAFLAVLGL